MGVGTRGSAVVYFSRVRMAVRSPGALGAYRERRLDSGGLLWCALLSTVTGGKRHVLRCNRTLLSTRPVEMVDCNLI